NEDATEEILSLRKLENEFLQKVDILERRYVEDGLAAHLYNKYLTEYEGRLASIRTEIALNDKKISNHSGFIEKSLKIVQNLSKYWASESVENKIRIQNLVFPEGVRIEPKNRQYLTSKVNKVFELTSAFTGLRDEVENK